MIVQLNITDDTVGFVFENFLNKYDTDEIKEAVLSKLKKFKKINLYLEEDEVDEIKMSAFIDQVIFDLKHADRFDKIAIVSNRKWIHGVTKIKDFLVSSNVKAFDLTERVEALCWIMRC